MQQCSKSAIPHGQVNFIPEDAKMVQHTHINQCDNLISKRKKKSHDHLNKYRKKTFDKIEHPFMMKPLNKFVYRKAALI